MKIDCKIKDHTDALEKIYRQRRLWLYASSIVYTFIIFLIFGWEYISKSDNVNLWWVVISLSLLVSVNWWYWTMQSISELVRGIYGEFQILNEVSAELSNVKTILRCKLADKAICKDCPANDVCEFRIK